MKHKNIILLSIGVILVITISIRVVYINIKYPSQKNNVYTMDQEMNYKGCIIKALSYQVGSPEICKSVLDDYDYDKEFGEKSLSSKLERKVVLVTVDIKNNSDTTFDSAELMIISGSAFNGMDVQLANYYNKNGFKVKSNCESQIILTYTITENNMTKKKWNNLENEEFALSCATKTDYNLLKLKK